MMLPIVRYVVMIITSVLLGFHWALLPTFVLEAVPGINLIPTWTGCVAFVVWRRRQADARAALNHPGGNVCSRWACLAGPHC